MRILGIIPARGGSKGIPKKNSKLLNGKPLLQYTIEVAKKCQLLDKLIVSSDDEQIIKLAKKLEVEVPFIRPKALAEDNTPTIEVVKHVLNHYEQLGEFFDAVCLLQVTSPFRTVEYLNKVIQTFKDKKTDSLITVQKVPDKYHPNWVFLLNKNGNLKIATGDKDIISRRQELPVAYHRDGNVYLTRTEVIKNMNSLYGSSISYIESPKEFSMNIDTIEDWESAEKHFQKSNEKE